MRVLLAAVAMGVAALLISEATMQPSGPDRQLLILTFGAVALLTALAGLGLARVTRRLRTLRFAVLLAAVGAVAAIGVTVLASSMSMFLSSHDLRLTLVAVGLGAGLGVVVARAVADSLIEDLSHLRDTADLVAAGDRVVRTGITRPDELGDLARTFDAMIERLGTAEQERDRMDAARRDFLAGVGHDLRTPLTSIRAALDAIADGVGDDPARYLSAARSDVDMLSGLVDDLFALARLEATGRVEDPERIDLRELVDEALEAVVPLAAQRAITVVATAGEVATIDGSEHDLRRLLRNLLDNALRYAPEGSQVSVDVSATVTEVVLQVRDEGPGFPADFTQRAFASFTRADAARTRDGGGAGLGLAIAQAIVVAHRGAITAAAGPGGVVQVRLPLARRPA